MIQVIEKLGKIKICALITLFSLLLSQGIINIIYFIGETQMSLPGRVSSFLTPLIIAPIFSWWFVGLLFRVKKLEKEMRELATYDYLTKVYSRNAVFVALESLLQVARRTYSSFLLLYIDIDYFKNINDKYGHDIGDIVLRNFGIFLKSRIRESDIVGRIGGEEFIIGLPDTGLDDGIIVAEKLRNEIMNENMHEDIKVTISIGVAIYNYTDVISLDHLIKVADKALYNAKKNGRNTVFVPENG